MLKHIVMFRMNELHAVANADQLKDKLDELKNKIPQIKELETGKNISESKAAFDLVLVTTFDNEEDLDIYRNHPEHREVLKFIEQYVDQVHMVDYIF